jgi:hypothetical protein
LVGITKFDRRRESINKMRNRMKQGPMKSKATYKGGNTKQLLDEEDEELKL